MKNSIDKTKHEIWFTWNLHILLMISIIEVVEMHEVVHFEGMSYQILTTS